MNPERQSVFSYTSHIPVNKIEEKEDVEYVGDVEFYVKMSNRVAIMYDIIDKGHDVILEASMQLLKAIKYHEKFIDDKNRMIIPLIVLDGKMYEYQYDKEEVCEITKLNYLSNGVPFDPTPIMIDIVHISQLQDYILEAQKYVKQTLL